MTELETIPEYCYSLLNTELLDESITHITPVILKRGEKGFFRTDWTWDKKYAVECLDECNSKLGVNPDVAIKMEAWSMFGWPAHFKVDEQPEKGQRLTVVLEYPNIEAIPHLSGQLLGGAICCVSFYDGATRLERSEKLLESAQHALQSYQYGNAAKDLAADIAAAIEKFLKGPTQ